MNDHIESWLNGWPRIGTDQVLMGTGVYCVGCGKDRGVTTVAFPDNFQFPEKPPQWPFRQENCPVCQLRQKEAARSEAPVDKLTERLRALRS